MENYTLNTENKDIVGGINEVNSKLDSGGSIESGTYNVYNFKLSGVVNPISGEALTAMVGDVEDFKQALSENRVIMNNTTFMEQSFRYPLLKDYTYIEHNSQAQIIGKIDNALSYPPLEFLLQTTGNISFLGGTLQITLESLDTGDGWKMSGVFISDTTIISIGDISGLSSSSDTSAIKSALQGFLDYFKLYVVDFVTYPVTDFRLLLMGHITAFNVAIQGQGVTQYIYSFDAIVDGVVKTYILTQTFGAGETTQEQWDASTFACEIVSKTTDTPYYIVNLNNISDSSSSEDISGAIGGWENLKAAIQSDKMVGVVTEWDGFHSLAVATVTWGGGSNEQITLTYSIMPSISTSFVIENRDGVLSVQTTTTNGLVKERTYTELQTENETVLDAINEIYETTPTIVLEVTDVADIRLFSSQVEGSMSGAFSELQFNKLKAAIERHASVIIVVPDVNGYNTTYQSSTCALHPNGDMSFLYFGYNNSDLRIFSRLCIVKADKTCEVHTKII